jgi:hypothetical protein
MIIHFFRSIFYPLVLLKRLLWNIIWHTVRFFLWRPKLLFFAPFIVLLFMLLNQGSHQPPPLPPDSDAAQKELRKQHGKISYPDTLPPISGPIADGVSRFSKNLLKEMTPLELRWYSHEFYKAMNEIQSGTHHIWQFTHNKRKAFGKISPGAAFHAKSGTICRPYSEILSVNNIAQQYRGYACRRDEGGWCRLGPSSALSCNLSRPGGLDGIMLDTKLFFDRLF